MDDDPDVPSTSKSKKASKEDPPEEKLPPELDIASEEFDPLRALYANPKIKLTKRKPKITFQNLDQLEKQLEKKGLYGLTDKLSPKKANEPKNAEASTSVRRFLPHQMAIQTTGLKAKSKRNLLRQIENVKGPMAVLRDCMSCEQEVKVYTRSEHGVRGTITGFVISFDKHWNILMRDVHETWKRRKYKYDENKSCGTPSDCSERLKELGITVPETKVKSLNRKNVELSRRIPQVLVRGEQVVLVIAGKLEKETVKK